MKLLSARMTLLALGVVTLASPAVAQRTEPLDAQQYDRFSVPGGVGRSPWGDDLIETGRMHGARLLVLPQTYMLPTKSPASTQDGVASPDNDRK